MVEEGFPREVILEHESWTRREGASGRVGGVGLSLLCLSISCNQRAAGKAGKVGEGRSDDLVGDRGSSFPLYFPSVALVWKVPLNSVGGSYAWV